MMQTVVIALIEVKDLLKRKCAWLRACKCGCEAANKNKVILEAKKAMFSRVVDMAIDDYLQSKATDPDALEKFTAIIRDTPIK
jgi:hypothetical protein